MKHVAQARPPPSHLRFYLNIRGPSPEHPHHFLNIGGPSPRQLHHLLNTRGASPERPYQFLKIRGPSPRHLHHSVNIKGPSPEYPYHFLNIGGPLPEGSYHFLTIEDLLNMISIRVFGHSVFQISKKTIAGLGRFWVCDFYRAWEDPPEVEQSNGPRTSGSLQVREVGRPSWYIRNGKLACLGE